MIRRLFLVYLTLGRVFGRWILPFALLAYVTLVNLLNRLACLLDPVLFPKLGHTRIQRPILVLGNPRSGTTFLHRFMIENGLGTGTRLWRMIFPSLTLQRLIAPFLPALESVSPARYHRSEAHETGLTAMETEEPAFLFRFFDGFFLYAFFLSWAEEDLWDEFDPSLRNTSARDYRWLEQLWRRQLVAAGETRIVGKMFSPPTQLRDFLAHFPDARILYLVRDPVKVVPSALSLIAGALDGLFGFWERPAGIRQRFVERVYRLLCESYRRFHADYTAGSIPTESILIVPFPRLMTDFEKMMQEILAFVESPVDTGLTERIREVAERQRGYASRHTYDLEQFGLDERRIRQDLSFVYATFLS